MKSPELPFQAGDSWVCLPIEAGTRLDKYLGERAPDVSRSRLQKWMEKGCFTLNGSPAKKNAKVAEGDVIAVAISPERQDTTLQPEDIPFPIVYEDKHLLVVDKPKGMVTHPGNGIYSGTLANALAFRFAKLSDVNGPMRPGILHRLDRDTSGLLVVAKDNPSHLHLARQLEARDIKRIYHALVWGYMAEPAGTIDQPIARNPRDPLKMGIYADGKRAVTHYTTTDFYQFASKLEVSLETGRTHQIRVHLSYIGHPVIGDPAYGGRQSVLGRMQPIHHPFASKLLSFFSSQALHAHKLSFVHPHTGKRMEFTSPLPKEMTDALAFLERFRETDSRA